MSLPIIKQPALWIASIAVLLVSIGLEFYGRTCGFLLTSDSQQYLSAAKSFNQAGNFLSPDGSYYSYWPPLFPIILSFFQQPQVALVLINIICKTLLLFVLLFFSNLFIKDPILKIIFLASSFLSVQVAMISVFVWSELIFMTLIFLSAYCALKLKQHNSYFYCLLVTGFLACLQRNAGLFWMCGICLWLLLDTSLPLKNRLLRSIACFFICTSGMWAWNIYNTFFIPADFSFYNHNFFSYIFLNLKSTLITFGKMIIPMDGIPAMLIGILFFLGTFLTVVKLKADRNIQFLGITLIFYVLGFLMMPGQLDFFEMDRYFSVVTPLVYLFIMIMVQEKTQPAKVIPRVCLCVFAFIWLCYPLTRTFINVQSWHERSCSAQNNK